MNEVEGKSKNGDSDRSKLSESDGVEMEVVPTRQRRSVECPPCGVYHCVYTDVPKFLVTYIPKVHVKVCCVAMCTMYVHVHAFIRLRWDC